MLTCFGAGILFLLTSSDSCRAAERSDDPRSLTDKVDRYIQPFLNQHDFSGVVLIAKGDNILLHRAYGMADFGQAIPNTITTRFHLASVTKTFTSAGILMLIEQDRLKLDDPVSKFLPEYPRGDEITIEHLLTYAAGTPDIYNLKGADDRILKPLTLEELVNWIGEHPLEFEPGTKSSYNNSCYAILTLLIETITGQSYEAYLRESILDPLDMHDTGNLDSNTIVDQMARGYVPEAGEHQLGYCQRTDISHAKGSGSMYSTAVDLYTWMKAVKAKRLYDHSPRQYQWASDGYPYGWGLRASSGVTHIEQTGMHPGFFSGIAFYPEPEIYIVVLSNIQSGDPFQRMLGDLSAIAFGDSVSVPEERHPIQLNPAQRDILLGRYHFENVSDFAITLRNDSLYLEWDSFTEREYLSPLADDRLYNRKSGVELVFITDDSGRVIRLRWGNNDDAPTCPVIMP